MYDLLDPSTQGLNLREDIKKGVFVDGLIEQTVLSASEAYQVLLTLKVHSFISFFSQTKYI